MITAEELFAQRGRSPSPQQHRAFRSAAALAPSPARSAAGGVAALQARLTQLAARAAAETNRRRAAEEGRAAAIEQRDAALKRASALEAELQHMHAALTSARDALADAAREVAIKEEVRSSANRELHVMPGSPWHVHGQECEIMADLCRAAQGAQPAAAPPSARMARSSAAEREAALMEAAEGDDGLPVALPMPSGVDHLEIDPPDYPWRRGERSPLRA